MKLSEIVQKYIEVRDEKLRLKAEYDAKIAKRDEVLQKIEAKLLEVFEQTGMDSIKTEFGTAYASQRTSASIADKEIFLNFVREKEEWPLLQFSCNKPALEDYRSANDGEIPPGINLRVERVVTFRRS